MDLKTVMKFVRKTPRGYIFSCPEGFFARGGCLATFTGKTALVAAQMGRKHLEGN